MLFLTDPRMQGEGQAAVTVTDVVAAVEDYAENELVAQGLKTVTTT